MVREVLEVILGLAKQGMTMVIVTHEMSFAQAVADKIVFIDKGSICEISEPDVFFTNPKTERAKHFLNIFQY
jgi:polar amino acid transport system ATP-binding protein